MNQNKSKEPGLDDLQSLVEKLRGPDGCPWDREQGLRDLKQYLLEECYEVLEAIEGSSFEKLREELGDLLFHIVFLAHLAKEKGKFGIPEVLKGIHEKMIRRHPHVFGDVSVENTDEVKKNWVRIKQAEEKQPGSVLGSVPKHLPALQRAYRLGKRASPTGLDWPGPRPVLEKIKEEIREMEQALEGNREEDIREELGDILFSLANLARHLNQNPEDCLQGSNNKFLERFLRMEERALREGHALETLSHEEMDRWWEEIKKEEESGR